MNLDAIQDQKELRELWMRFKTHPVREGRLLFPDRPKGYVSATYDLANYAINKSVAIGCRLNGKIDTALKYEADCDLIYEGLPDYAKW